MKKRKNAKLHDELRGVSTNLERKVGIFLVNMRLLFPRSYRFMTSPPHEYWYTKALLGFPFGLLLGVGLYYSVVSKIGLPEKPQQLVGFIFIVSMGIGYAISVQIRCMSLLVIPVFFGKHGRSCMGAIALGILLSGPITSIMYNAKESTRAMTCSSLLASNLSSSRLKLRLSPLKHIMKDLQRQAVKMQYIVSKVKKRFKPVQKEVEDDDEVEKVKKTTEDIDGKNKGRIKIIEARAKKDDGRPKVEKKYERKLDYRCEEVFSLGVTACKKSFYAAEQRCRDKMSIVADLFCWPLKLTMICELANLLPKMTGTNCDSMESVNPGFGGSFEQAEKAAEQMNEHFEVKIRYKVIETSESIDIITPEEVAKNIEHQLNMRQKYFDFFVSFFQKILAFMFLKVIRASFKYHQKYISDFKHDNIYINMYFRWIDKRRALQGKTTLLPLKKSETASTIVPSSMKFSKAERAKLTAGTFRLFTRFITFLLIIFIDRLIYEVLELVREHTHVDYYQTGEHRISAKVKGSGVMAEILRGLLGGFSQSHTLKQHVSNKRCLPHAMKTDTRSLIDFVSIFILMELLVIGEAYGLRCRRLIAGFFYRKREKKRTLYLYNDMLKKRKGFLHRTRKRIARKVRQRKLEVQVGILDPLVRKYPKLFRWLRLFGVGKKKCLICDEKAKKTYVSCPNPGCKFGYCADCWRDIEGRCYACREDDDWSSELTASEEEEMIEN